MTDADGDISYGDNPGGDTGSDGPPWAVGPVDAGDPSASSPSDDSGASAAGFDSDGDPTWDASPPGDHSDTELDPEPDVADLDQMSTDAAEAPVDPLLGDGRPLAAFSATDWAPVGELPTPGAEPVADAGNAHPGRAALADLARTWSVAEPAGGPPFDTAAPTGELLQDISIRAADPDLRGAAAVAVRLLPEQRGPDRR